MAHLTHGHKPIVIALDAFHFPSEQLSADNFDIAFLN
jgi:hypothetical protein